MAHIDKRKTAKGEWRYDVRYRGPDGKERRGVSAPAGARTSTWSPCAPSCSAERGSTPDAPRKPSACRGITAGWNACTQVALNATTRGDQGKVESGCRDS